MARSLFYFFSVLGGGGGGCGYSFSLLDYLDNSFMIAVITTILGPFWGAIFTVF